MKKTLLGLTILALCLAAIPAIGAAEDKDSGQLSSVGFDVHGYYRARYFNYFDTRWFANDPNDKSNWWAWFDQRLVLQPTLIISDPIQIVSEFNILDNVSWGQASTTVFPTVVTQRAIGNVQQIQNVSYGTITIPNSSIFSRSMSTTDKSGQLELSPFEVRQLFARLVLPFGYLKIGRQGAHWGMGIYDNSGSPYSRFMEKPGEVTDRNAGFDNDGGDFYDRVLIAGRVAGFYYPMLYYDRIASQSFKVSDQDVNAITFANQFRDIEFAGKSGLFDAGFFIQNRNQHAVRGNLWFYDVWGRVQYAGFLWEVEGVAYQGRATFFKPRDVHLYDSYGLPTGDGGGKVGLDAYNAAFHFKYDSGRWGTDFNYGFSSPSARNASDEYSPSAQQTITVAKQTLDADPGNPINKVNFTNAVVANQQAFGRKINTYAFNPEYKVDLITWDQLMGGAFQNGMFFKVGGYVRPLDAMNIRLDIINSYINQPGLSRFGKQSQHDLGWEADLDYSYTFYKQFTLDGRAGYMLPGNYFRDTYSHVKNVMTGQIRTIVNF